MNYALITALNQYDKKVYGPDATLKMCLSDADKFERMVIPDDWLRVRLLDAECLRNEVLGNLDWIAQQIQPGEIFYWFHSGHGTYQDRGRSRATGRCMHDGVLWDTEVAKAIAKFPAGVLVFTISDTCYSESNSRKMLAPPADFTDCTRKTIGKAAATPPPSAGKLTFDASVIHLSACTAAQVSWETRETGGLFTHCLTRIRSNYPDASIGQLPRLLKAFLMDYEGFNQTPVMWTNQRGKAKKPFIFSIK